LRGHRQLARPDGDAAVAEAHDADLVGQADRRRPGVELVLAVGAVDEVVLLGEQGEPGDQPLHRRRRPLDEDGHVPQRRADGLGRVAGAEAEVADTAERGGNLDEQLLHQRVPTGSGSGVSRAASISPRSSRRSGAIQRRPSAEYTSCSLREASRTPSDSRATQYSLSVRPIRSAWPRRRTLCPWEPVKYCQAAPKLSNGTARQSTWK